MVLGFDKGIGWVLVLNVVNAVLYWTIICKCSNCAPPGSQQPHSDAHNTPHQLYRKPATSVVALAQTHSSALGALPPC